MNKLLIFGLFLFGVFILSGCIQGEQRHEIKADGSDIVEAECYKTGLLANADCNQLKSYMRTFAINFTKKQLESIEAAPCRETATSIIINGIIRINDESSKVKIVKRNGKEYLRFEDISSPFFEITVKMPSKITDTNGQKIDANTAIFQRSELFFGETKTVYVESEKPSSFCCLPTFIFSLVFVGLIFKFEMTEGIK